MTTSRLKGFYKHSLNERHRCLAKNTRMRLADLQALASGAGFDVDLADSLVENAIGVFPLPLGVACNFKINNKDVVIPMAIEESSVIAAASHAAKLLRGGEGIEARASEPVMIGQLQLLNVDDAKTATACLLANKESLISLANATQPRLIKRGGGARNMEVRRVDSPELGPMLIIHLHVHVVDAMGANIVNTMMEQVAPEVERLTNGEVHLRILSNLSDLRTVTVIGRVPFSDLARGGMSGKEVAERVQKASIFAELDPYRAATHNKGIMNGIDAVLLATGQDFRAVEAGAHAYAARGGSYTSLSKWRVQGDALVGELTLPLAVGTVGGVTKIHPVVKSLLKMLNVTTAGELAEITASAGLAQNLAAILALSTEGIQRGHMSLHARNIALAVGARGELLDRVVDQMIASKLINSTFAADALAAMLAKAA